MNEGQAVLIIAAFAILALATMAAHFHWLRDGSLHQRILFFLAGAAISASLFLARIPPKWFNGSTAAFTLAASLTLGAFVGRDARGFRLPLLLGMGGTLLVLNVLPHF
jgi:peptidoglycan/LPS O-acetylase OafA/YrhL